MAFDVVLVQAVEDWDFARACECKEFLDVLYNIGASQVFCNGRVHQARWVEEVIIRVDENDRGVVDRSGSRHDTLQLAELSVTLEIM